MPRGRFIPFNEEDSKFIRDNYLSIPVKPLAERLGVSFGRIKRFLERNNLEIPKALALQRKQDSYLKKGHTPFNKGKKQIDFMSAAAIKKTSHTRFKKGHIPYNTNYNGHERITKDGYVEVRISRGIYRLKHLVRWEKINGKLPKHHCLKCQDGDVTNTHPDNWKLITRVENMYNNSKINYPKEVIPSLVLNNKLQTAINYLEDGQ